MHYHESRAMRIGNALCEFVLILLAFAVAGVLRAAIPLASKFYMNDIVRFFPIGALYAAIMVACYAFEGDYATLHLRNKSKVVVHLALTDLIGFALMATLLYVFRISQFSRLLLGYFYVLSVTAVFLKRCILERVAENYVRRHHMSSRVLLIGSGDTAQRFYRGVILKNSVSMEYAGYLAAQATPQLPDWQGQFEDMHRVLEQQKINMIVIAQEEETAAMVRQTVAIADGYHIRVCIVPVYSDYVNTREDISFLGGLRMVDLKLLDTCDIMGVKIAVTDMNKTLTLIDTQLEKWRGKYICVANVHTTVTAHENADYQKVQNGAVIALPDGGPLSSFSREQGYDGAQRVTGPDLMREVLAISAEKGWRSYFYGSTEKTLADLKTKIEKRYPGVAIAGMYSPPFRELTPQEDAEIVRRINETKPDFVWVGLGAPKQERWMAAHEDRVNALMVGVGAAFDYEAGNIKRAPQWMQKHNLEWLYRLLQDPKRLFNRYLTTNAKYLWWKWRQ